MDEAELIEAASQALDEAREAAVLMPSTYADRHGPSQLDEVVADIRGRLVARTSPNPSYEGQHRLAACMLLLAATDHGRYEMLTEGVTRAWRGTDRSYPSLVGLAHMASLLNLLSDDHDMCLANGPDGPALVIDDGRRCLTCPAELLAAIEPLLAGPMPSP